jgi:hypothetical protein
MNQLIKTIILRFFIGGTILSASTFLANMSSPLLASIIVTVPLELVSLFFVQGQKRDNYATSILIMSIATVVPVLYYFLIMGKTNMSATLEVISSFGIWLICSLVVLSFRSTILQSRIKENPNPIMFR